jgi:hypothetical protein
MLLFLLACQAEPVDVPDAWTRAEAACGEPSPWFDVKLVRPIETLVRRPSPACEAVLRDDFGLTSDVGLSAAWSLVLWPVDPDAYDAAAFEIDDLDAGAPTAPGAWASFDQGAVTVSALDEVVGFVGASVLVHEGSHAWAPRHVACVDGVRACDRDDGGALGAQVRYLDAVIAEADRDDHTRGGTLTALQSFRDGVEARTR